MKNLIFLTLVVGLVSVLATGQTVGLNFENLQLTEPTRSVTVTNRFSDQGIKFSNETALESSVKNGFAHSGKQVLQSGFGLEFCLAPIEMTFTRPQKRIKVWAGFDYPGNFGIYLRVFDRYNRVLQSIKKVKEPLLITDKRNPPRLSAYYRMYSLEVNFKSNSIVRAEVGIIPTPGDKDIRPVSIDDLEFERIR